ncbi:MAG: hypothetical protein HY909_02020 [Deltaproteobacteria bacterium]|nr:hypothetical protein [Deltaproteobacteria bacterium]
MPTVDMSAEAILARVREASQLRRATLALERAARAAGIENGRVVFRPGARTDLPRFAEPDASHLLCVDLGFAAEEASCGLAINHEVPTLLTFGACCEEVAARLRSWHPERPVALVLEAPLSMAFRDGNPCRRGAFERRDDKARGWYHGTGAPMLLAARTFLARLRQVPLAQDREVTLFEGFVSFKGERSDHRADAIALRDAVRRGHCRVHEVPGGQSILEDLFGVPGAPVVLEPLPGTVG